MEQTEELEWVPEITGQMHLLAAGEEHRCSAMHCTAPAVAYFRRMVYRNVERTYHPRRQFCCTGHLYGRRIVDGQVQLQVAVGSWYWKQAKGMEV